ncbi:MAG: hypothetical protein OFPI_39040 [Osedax symbiont Rs2]|nr:MAG: hypothetical protein OFPI_39040 [Osedax symbiont Rs2]
MQDRISELESRVAFQEEMIDQLNDVVAKQDKVLMDLSRVVTMLNHKVNLGGQGEGGIEANEPPPPHY